MNLLREIRLRSRSGTELSRVENLNLYSKIISRYYYPQGWIDKFGTLMGFGSSSIGATDPAILSEGVAVRFCIPLKMLCPFFNPKASNQLLPPHLASGMECSLVLEDFRTALFEKTTSLTSYSITQPSFVLDLVDLTDSTQRSLNMESANSGLEWTYDQVYVSSNSLSSGQTNVNVQISKAVSQAEIVFSIMIPSANLIDQTVDSFNAPVWDILSWGMKLGNLNFPNEKINDILKDGKESFFNSQMVFDKVNHPYNEGSVSMTQFKSGGAGIMSCSLEKMTHLQLSGLPVNNSRSIELSATLDTYTGARQLYTFLVYTSVCKAFIDNVAVSI